MDRPFDGDSGTGSDWTLATRALLDALSPLQRAWVEWRADRLTGAEAYRRAAGRDPGVGARNNSRQIAVKAGVREALAAALGERAAGARVEWDRLLGLVRAELDSAELAPAGDRQEYVERLTRLAARLERVLRSDAGTVRRSSPATPSERAPPPSDVGANPPAANMGCSLPPAPHPRPWWCWDPTC
jgi:hypothetical protein